MMSGKNKVWLGTSTSGVVKCNDGGLLFKARFIDRECRMVNRYKRVFSDQTRAIATKQWQAWANEIKGGI